MATSQNKNCIYFSPCFFSRPGKHHPSSFPQSPLALPSHSHQHGRLLRHRPGKTTVSASERCGKRSRQVVSKRRTCHPSLTPSCCRWRFSRASAAVNNLKRFHEKKKRGLKPHSLYLDHIIRKSVSSHNRRESHSRSHRDVYIIKVKILCSQRFSFTSRAECLECDVLGQRTK